MLFVVDVVALLSLFFSLKFGFVGTHRFEIVDWWHFCCIIIR